MRRLLLVLALAGCDPNLATDEEREDLRPATTKQCPTDTVEGIDIYSGQGTVDWSMVASSGRRFAFIKASQGDYNTQSTFPAQWSGAKAAGILRGPYHFFDATIDGVTQANHFLAVVNAAGGLQPGDLPPLLDLECPTSGTQSSASANCEYTGNSGWIDHATLVQRTFDFLDTVEAATGRRPLIYSYPSWFPDNSFTDARLATYPLYIATYSTCASVPAPWTTTVFWQYSGSGTVPGIHGNCDLDRFMGTEAELEAYANGTTMGDIDAGTPPPVDARPAGADAAQADAHVTPAPDAHVTDARTSDAFVVNDGMVSSGCSVGGRGGGGAWLLAGLAIAAARRRRRTAASRS
jgi:lysozyme